MRPFALLLLAAALAAPVSEAASLNPARLARAFIRRQTNSTDSVTTSEGSPIQPPYAYDSANPGWSQNLIVDPSTSTTAAGAQPSAVAGDAGGNATNGDGSAPSLPEILNPNDSPVSGGASSAAGVTTTTDGATATTSAAATTTTGATGSTSLLDAGPTQPADGSVPSDLAGIDIPSGAVPEASGGADGNANGGTTTTTTSVAAGETTGADATTTVGAGETTTTDGGATATTTGAEVTTPPVDSGGYTTGRRYRCKPKSTSEVQGGGEEVTTTPCTKTTTTTPCTKTTTTTPCTTTTNVEGGAEEATTTTPCTKTTTTTTPCTKTKTKKTKTKTKKATPTGNANLQDVENASNSMIELLTQIQASVDIPGLIDNLKETTGVSNFELSALLSNIVETFNTKGTISFSDIVQSINDAAGGTNVSSADILADFVDSLKNGAKEADVISLLEKLADSVKDFNVTELEVLAQMIEKAQFTDA